MKALCVRQPWAWLLFHGKPIENRGWRTSHRGPLAIVASKNMSRDEYFGAVDFVRSFDPRLAALIPEPESLVFGAALGVVQQVGCVAMSDSPWFQGKYGHVYEAPKLFRVPILTKGQLSMFDWTPEARDAHLVAEVMA